MLFDPITLLWLLACIVCFGAGILLGIEIGRWRGWKQTEQFAADARYRLFTGRGM